MKTTSDCGMKMYLQWLLRKKSTQRYVRWQAPSLPSENEWPVNLHQFRGDFVVFSSLAVALTCGEKICVCVGVCVCVSDAALTFT